MTERRDYYVAVEGYEYESEECHVWASVEEAQMLRVNLQHIADAYVAREGGEAIAVTVEPGGEYDYVFDDTMGDAASQARGFAEEIGYGLLP